MKEVAEKMEFEKAEMLRKKIEHLENYASRSVIVNKRMSDADVFSMIRDADKAYVNYLMLQNGTIVQTHSTQVETHLDESDSEVLAFVVSRLRDVFESSAKEIIVPLTIEYPQEDISVVVPKAGDKKRLLELSEKNVAYYRDDLEQKKRLHLDAKSANEQMQVLDDLMEDLQLSELPVHIECFDNSNFQGSYPVSAMVCFRNGMPSKKDYRHFNVKTVKGINDFATMHEVVTRRYKRLMQEQQSLPQLVIIDGGKGQLHAALEAIEALGLTGSLTLVGLAKNEEEIFFAEDKESLKLPYNSESLKFIRSIRDEVHRFGINFHRNKRSSGTFKNELEDIEGIGKSTSEKLLKEFRSVNKVSQLTIEELAEVVGESKARLIDLHFKQQKANK
jgi:excinuclease ABC subunit C